jgi:hypothetical protein
LLAAAVDAEQEASSLVAAELHQGDVAETTDAEAQVRW